MTIKKRNGSLSRSPAAVLAVLISLLAISQGLAQRPRQGPRQRSAQGPGQRPARGLAEFPEKFENLQVLPEDISRAKLRETMRSFAMALGVRCHHCHVGEEGAPPSSFDFASDEKPPKEKARLMIRMVKAINETHLTKLDEPPEERIQVQCVTCHHGQSEPRLLEEILAEVHAKDSLEAAISKYRDLKQKYYGGFSYDFQEQSLISFAQHLAMAKNKPEDAVAILKLNVELHPQSANTYFFLGEIYRMQRKLDLAKANFEKALALDPSNRRARGRLRQLSRRR